MVNFKPLLHSACQVVLVVCCHEAWSALGTIDVFVALELLCLCEVMVSPPEAWIWNVRSSEDSIIIVRGDLPLF